MKYLFSTNVLRVLVIVLPLFLSSCKKQNSFLDEKPNASLSTITNIVDIQNLLRNENLFNQNDPSLGEMMCDDFYLTDDDIAGSFLVPYEQKIYGYASDLFTADDQVSDWNFPYQQVYQANIILDALPKVSGSDDQKNQAKGQALFFRSFAFYNLLQTFALPYDSLSSKSDLGIILKLTSDLNDKSGRATVSDSYRQIFSDLNNALNILPATTQYNTQPNKIAANALFARIYLAIGKYDSALYYSNKALSTNSQLFDYNNFLPSDYSLTDNSQYPLQEDIYHTALTSYKSVSFYPTEVDSDLLKLYDTTDIRSTAFYTNYSDGIRFKGSYEFRQFGLNYDGLATDELYLIRAECRARLNDVNGGMDDLNTLLKNRYITGTFNSRVALNGQDALDQILVERRKELVFRGLRWTDLRRLNKDPKYAVTLKRVIQGHVVTLPANDPKYALQIPITEIQLSSIKQNAR